MGNRLTVHPFTKISKRKKKEKKKKQREKRTREEVGPVFHAERERDRKGQGTASTSMELADRPNLAPARDKGQWQRAEVRGRVGRWVENLKCGFQLSV